MPRVRIPIIADIFVEKFTGSTIDITSHTSTNVIFDKYPDGTPYVMQRPSFDIFSDASANSVTDMKGRGCYFWNQPSKEDIYFVQDNDLYRDDYGITALGQLTTGHGLVYMSELGSNLLLLDPQNNQGWTWDGSTLTEVTDAQFPSKNSKTIVDGLVVLDGTAYVFTKEAELWGSDLNDFTSWSATNFIGMDKEPDDGVAIAKHYDHIVCFGTRTVQFAYNAGNPVASPLSIRSDVAFNIGCVEGESVSRDMDLLFWLGISTSGEVGVYQMIGFKPVKITNSSLDSFLTSATQLDNARAHGQAFSTGGRTYYAITIYNVVNDTKSSETTLVYDSKTKTWAIWEHASSSIKDFPIVGWTQSNSNRRGEGILASGDMVAIFDDFNPQDSTGASAYVTGSASVTGTTNVDFNNGTSDITRSSGTTPDFTIFDDGDVIVITGTSNNNTNFTMNGTPTAADMNTTVAPTTETGTSATLTRPAYVNSGYVTSDAAVGDSIPITVRMGHLDADTYSMKWVDQLRIVGDQTVSTQTLTVKWSDGDHAGFNAGRTIDLSNNKNKLTGLGTAKDRTFEISGSFSEQVRLVGLDINYRIGDV